MGFDLDTTGFDHRKDRIVQYALVGSDTDGTHINLQSLVDPRVKIPPETTRVHGISNDDVKGMGEFSQHVNEIISMIDDSIIVGHNFIRFYYPHDDTNEWDEWGSNFNFDIDPYFDRDIRNNDYQSLFSEEKGINWFAIIEPTLIEDTSETKLDSIYFQVNYLEGIKCSHIKIALDREKGEVVNNFDYVIENNQLGIKVDTEKSFSVLINVSNICIQEFGESCPDEY